MQQILFKEEWEQLDDPMEDWRYDELRKRGVRPLVAYELCRHSDVVHNLDELLKKGCPLETATRILR